LHPDSPHTAEALYWLGQAQAAVGQAQGRERVAQARRQLARSPVASHRKLAADAALR
jgi:TolA-binding protein